MLADILRQNNVDHSGMSFDPYTRTALAFVTMRNYQEGNFMFYRNPCVGMLPGETEIANLIKKVKSQHSI